MSVGMLIFLQGNTDGPMAYSTHLRDQTLEAKGQNDCDLREEAIVEDYALCLFRRG